jgi:hypothetical protein
MSRQDARAAPDERAMHDLAVRDQEDALTALETKELHAFSQAAAVLSILKSKARRTLGVRLKT